MSKTISVATYHAVKAKADAGDIRGAWQVLADAGDNYARAGAAIMDPNGDSFIKSVVEKTWELEVGLDVFNAKFAKVAADHLSGYLTIVQQSIGKQPGAILPTTFQIETSYKKALDRHGVSHNASIDAIINRIGGIGPHWARLLDAFDGYWSNVYDIDASRIKGDHAIYSEHSQFNAAIALTRIAATAAAGRSGPEADFLNDPYASVTPDNSDSGGDGNGPLPGTPNPDNVFVNGFKRSFGWAIEVGLTHKFAVATGLPPAAVNFGKQLLSRLFGFGSDNDGRDDNDGNPNVNNGPPNSFGEYGRPNPYTKLTATPPAIDNDGDGPTTDPEDHDSTYPGGGDPFVDREENDPPPSTETQTVTPPTPPTSTTTNEGDGGDRSNGNDRSGRNGEGGFGSHGGSSNPADQPGSGAPGTPGRSGSSGNSRSGSSSSGSTSGGTRSGNSGGNYGSGGDGDGGGNSGGGGFKPIVFDLDGDGVELVALDESAVFYDINADGYQYNLGWAGKDDGLLAYDKNNDGVINRKDEISFVDYVPGAQTDLDGLRHFDTNTDGVLDSRDVDFGKFRVWQDANQNGVSDAGELRALAAAGIERIELNYAPGDDGQAETRAGNRIAGEGRYHKTNGAVGKFADVSFATSAFGFRTDGDNLEFKSSDGQGKVYVAPSNAGAVNMNFASAVHAAHIGAIGGGGDDVLNGAGVSRDLLLFGDDGDDRLTGGSGDDWLAGGAGADTLRGGAGHDVLFFDASDDVHGGDGQDIGVVSGNNNIDLSMGVVGLEALHSGDGDDRLRATDSTQGVIIDGGGGFDTIYGGGHRDVLSGGDGDDFIKGKPGDDVILGGAGNDRLYGNFGDDILFGGDGDDYLNGLVGDDALYGGEGSDTYDFGYPNVPTGALPDFGIETVRDSGGDNDKVTFGRRRHEELWLAKDGDDLRISILGGEDQVLIEDHFAAGRQHRIEHLHATTRIRPYGRYNTQSVSIDALVAAMAQFNKPQTGWASMSAQQRADIHTAWHTVGIAPTVG